MDRAKLMLETEQDSVFSRWNHTCNHCEKPLTDEELLVLDDLPEHIGCISRDEKLSLFFHWGYIASKHEELKRDPIQECENFSKVTVILTRSGLCYPSNGLFQFLMHAYMFFNETSKVETCRKRLQNILKDFPALFHLDIDMNQTALTRIIKMLMKRFCLKVQNGIATSENKRKVAKLSSTSQ
ncbi:hypothetical protein ElyMa_002761800 [Elysia marginata]|uniref:Uncharacterized protein n=1 Tax=Elysia marginata TaxID=1093978 RepID=A0AAV4HIV5_9GAST|nr:hypothetical protein ElyMa_002761800 [Elysia marginata]